LTDARDLPLPNGSGEPGNYASTVWVSGANIVVGAAGTNNIGAAFVSEISVLGWL